MFGSADQGVAVGWEDAVGSACVHGELGGLGIGDWELEIGVDSRLAVLG